MLKERQVGGTAVAVAIAQFAPHAHNPLVGYGEETLPLVDQLVEFGIRPRNSQFKHQGLGGAAGRENTAVQSGLAPAEGGGPVQELVTVAIQETLVRRNGQGILRQIGNRQEGFRPRIGTIRQPRAFVEAVDTIHQARTRLDFLYRKATGGDIGVGHAEAEAQTLGFLDRITKVQRGAEGIRGIARHVDFREISGPVEHAEAAANAVFGEIRVGVAEVVQILKPGGIKANPDPATGAEKVVLLAG